MDGTASLGYFILMHILLKLMCCNQVDKVFSALIDTNTSSLEPLLTLSRLSVPPADNRKLVLDMMIHIWLMNHNHT